MPVTYLRKITENTFCTDITPNLHPKEQAWIQKNCVSCKTNKQKTVLTLGNNFTSISCANFLLW